ncbi:MAG TPA: tRNA lysidine(34) synthetase TilS [Arthrobacter sp.]|nr:tRNA lysidine(34) synthetase TilS [Arthrobacter sp.]
MLVACSGGPDSLALAAVTAFFARRGDITAGAVVVDHGLQQQSASVAAKTGRVLSELGLNPVEVVTVQVNDDGSGPEGAARQARYRALDEAAERHGASTVLLGHTLDDQAESVLLGLARGSGTRSLAGMPARRGRYLRPFLGLRRADTEAICAAEGLQPWHDPTNSDPAYLRSRVRAEVLPYLEEKLGPGIAESLHRSAEILSEDADFLEAEAARVYAELAVVEPDATGPERVRLPEHELRQLPSALQHRVLALTAVELGAEQPSRERILAAAGLLQRRGSAGPVQLAGKVEVYRQVFGRDVPSGKRGYGSLVFTAKR